MFVCTCKARQRLQRHKFIPSMPNSIVNALAITGLGNTTVSKRDAKLYYTSWSYDSIFSPQDVAFKFKFKIVYRLWLHINNTAIE